MLSASFFLILSGKRHEMSFAVPRRRRRRMRRRSKRRRKRRKRGMRRRSRRGRMRKRPRSRRRSRRKRIRRRRRMRRKMRTHMLHARKRKKFISQAWLILLVLSSEHVNVNVKAAARSHDKPNSFWRASGSYERAFRWVLWSRKVNKGGYAGRQLLGGNEWLNDKWSIIKLIKWCSSRCNTETLTLKIRWMNFCAKYSPFGPGGYFLEFGQLEQSVDPSVNVLRTKAGVGAEPFRACTEHAWLKTGASLHPEPLFFGMD